MAVPFSYSLRNLWTRRLTTILTVSGMALVVFVFATILMLAEGLQKTLVETGSYDNVVVIRKGSGSEVMSGVDRQQASVVEVQPEVAVGPDGRRMLVKELVVLIALPKRDSGQKSNVVLRGIMEASPVLRPQVKLVAGRLPRMGTTFADSGASGSARHSAADSGTGGLWDSSTPAPRGSTRRSGGMPTSSCRPSGGPSIRPFSSSCGSLPSLMP
jgi:hypothetical protein